MKNTIKLLAMALLLLGGIAWLRWKGGRKESGNTRDERDDGDQ